MCYDIMDYVDKHKYISEYLLPDHNDLDGKTPEQVYAELLNKWGEGGSIYYYAFQDRIFNDPNDDYTQEIQGDEITFEEIKDFVEWAQS